MRAILATALALAALGCGSYRVEPRSSPNLSVPQGMGLVCVAHLGEGRSSSAVPVWDNGALVGATQGRSRFCYVAEPGLHVLVTELLVSSELRVLVRADRVHWIVQRSFGSSFRRGGVGSRGLSSGRRPETIELALPTPEELALAQHATPDVTLTEAPSGEALHRGGPVPSRRD